MDKRPVLDKDIIELLDALYTEYRDHLTGIMQSGDGNAVTGYNAKGDRQRRFDVLIDEWVRDWLSRRGVDGVVLSEEIDDVEFGAADAGHCFVVDPVDGSENCCRVVPRSHRKTWFTRWSATSRNRHRFSHRAARVPTNVVAG